MHTSIQWLKPLYSAHNGMFRKELPNTVLSNCVSRKIKTYRTQCVSCKRFTWELTHLHMNAWAYAHASPSFLRGGDTDVGVTVSVALLPSCWCCRLHNTWRRLAASAVFCVLFFIFFLALFFFVPSRTFFNSLDLIFVKQIFWGLHKSPLNLFKYMPFLLHSNLISE